MQLAGTNRVIRLNSLYRQPDDFNFVFVLKYDSTVCHHYTGEKGLPVKKNPREKKKFRAALVNILCKTTAKPVFETIQIVFYSFVSIDSQV